MTHYRKQFPTDSAEQVQAILETSKDTHILKRAQAIYCRVAHNMSLSQISEITGYTILTIVKLHSRFLREGMDIFTPRRRGGRNNSYMTPENEAKFLEEFTKNGDAGEILQIKAIHKAHCKKVGNKDMPVSTTYRLLKRHGWRKIMPRPKHPKSNKEAQADFKKMA